MSRQCENYTVGWLCAKDIERVAACVMLDEVYSSEMEPDIDTDKDNNSYVFGRIDKHHVVIAGLPEGRRGTTPATVVASHLRSSFPHIVIKLMVGIGGGAPTSDNDIRLGDVVVSTPIDRHGGVVQYDDGKAIQNQEFKITSQMNAPPGILLQVVGSLKAKHVLNKNRIDAIVRACIAENPRLQRKFSKPEHDRLYVTEHDHYTQQSCDCQSLASKLEDTNMRQKLTAKRHERTQEEDDPMVHYGLIASANTLLKDAIRRDKFAAEHKVLCFEMEAAGLMNDFPCLVIRGISDYSDTHKNDDWQGYAAITAAAYAKELLQSTRGGRCLETVPVTSLTSSHLEEHGQTSGGIQRALPWHNNGSTSGQSHNNERVIMELVTLSQSEPLIALRSPIQLLRDENSLLVESLDYWAHMTLDGYMIYEQIFKRMLEKAGRRNILWFAECMGNASPRPGVLIAMWERFRSDSAKLEELPDYYLVALLYTLHVEVFCNQFSQDRPKMDTQSPKEIHWQYLKRLRSFMTWIPCSSPHEGCNLTWNFVSQNHGIPRIGDGLIPSNCLIHKRYLERERHRLETLNTEVMSNFTKQENKSMDDALEALFSDWYKLGRRR